MGEQGYHAKIGESGKGITTDSHSGGMDRSCIGLINSGDFKGLNLPTIDTQYLKRKLLHGTSLAWFWYASKFLCNKAADGIKVLIRKVSVKFVIKMIYRCEGVN